MTARRLLLSFLVFTPLAALGVPIDFNRDVRPILSEKCYHCHGADEESRKAKLRLDLRDEALKDRDGFRAIVPERPEDSELMVRIQSTDPDEVMPPPKEHHTMTPAEIDTLRRWIKEGAPYAEHWSFQKPQKPAVPDGAKSSSGGRHPIDAFISTEQAKHDLTLSAEADRHTLIRRLSLDLTGLPPTPEEVQAFVSDSAPDFYEKTVDRLLASPRFGERWARMWLDLARYADSTGYGSDKFRLNIWPYRDWVIGAFNRNVPYDQFTIEQLAGDLLPNATPEQISATAFHRNTMTQTEGGTDDEEYRVAAIKDRVAVTGQVWMGLTLGCAQCHTHKFDPISHREYYQFFAIFNQTEDADREDEAPKMPLPTPAQSEGRDRIKAEIAALEAKLNVAASDFDEELHAWEASMAKPVDWRAWYPDEATTRAGTLTVLDDGSLRAPEKLEAAEKYTLKFSGDLRGITALRLEALPPAEGKAVGPEGNAVLSEIEAVAEPATSGPVRGRFVRLVHQPRAYLQIAELEVFSGSENVARKGKASQSSTYEKAAAERAIDGRTDGVYDRGSVAHSDENDASPWWELDLGAESPMDRIIFWNRAEAGERIKGAELLVLDNERRVIFSQKLEQHAPKLEFDPRGGVRIPFARATADFEQDGWTVTAAIDGDKKTGWAFAPAQNRPHAAIFEFKQPLDLSPAMRLKLTLRQDYGSQHNLVRVRISGTTQAGPLRELPADVKATLALEPSERTPEQRAAVTTYFRPLSKAYSEVNQQIAGKKAELAKIRPIELPVLRELPREKRRKTWILNKGNYLLHGEEVSPGLLAAFHPAPLPNADATIDRLALARWIANPENPLTSRVAVNRFWAQLFGTGLVESEEDFGTQGQLPSHPELLDWLAVTFQSPKQPDASGLGWDMKALIKLLVTSQTYRQSSKATAEHLQKDPRNRWLARYPRRRLEAEAVRDQALALAGLLSPKIGGPSVYPPQPEGLWSVAFNGGQDKYPTSTGEDRYRRGLYTFWRRIAPNPTMATFDAPSRETCTIRRVPTNTPLQAFVTLNDPVYVEAAQALARRIMKSSYSNTKQRIRWALELCLSRPASDAQIAPLQTLFDSEIARYQQSPDEAKKLATDPLGPLPDGLDPAKAAAWTSVANVLLNMDGVLMKN